MSGTEWTIQIEPDEHGGDRVEVLRHGTWFSDADDLDDAIGILGGQRATEVVVNEHGHVTRMAL